MRLEEYEQTSLDHVKSPGDDPDVTQPRNQSKSASTFLHNVHYGENRVEQKQGDKLGNVRLSKGKRTVTWPKMRVIKIKKLTEFQVIKRVKEQGTNKTNKNEKTKRFQSRTILYTGASVCYLQ